MDLHVVNWPDSVLVTTPVPASQSVSDPYGVYDLSDEAARVLTSFGGETATPPDRMSNLMRRVSPAIRGSFWAWRQSPYRLERWSTGGGRIQAIERTAPWFEPEVPTSLVRPVVQDVQEDRSGRLWIFLNMPLPDWEEALPVAPGSPTEFPVEAIAFERMYVSRVEVLDPTTGRLVARTDLDSWIVSSFPRNRAAIYGTTELGVPFVRIVQLSLREQ